MSNKKQTILDALASGLETAGCIKKATRNLLTPAKARDLAPYVGIVSGMEEVLVEDSSDIRYGLDVDLILLRKGDDIEKMIDDVKTYIYTSGTASTIGAKWIGLIGQQPVNLIEADGFSSSRVVLYIIYVASKASF